MRDATPSRTGSIPIILVCHATSYLNMDIRYSDAFRYRGRAATELVSV